MKSKLTNRLLATLVIAVVLSVLFAVSSLAAITGGNGEIEGLDFANKTYQAKAVTINTAGNGKLYGTEFSLTEATNKDLAGLYAVSDDGFTTETLVYVYGKYAEREALYETAFSSSANRNEYIISKEGNTFKPGYIYSTKAAQAAGTTNGLKYVNFQLAHSSASVKALINAADAAARTTALETYKARYKEYCINYAFTSNQILPINDVKSYSYSVKGYSSTSKWKYVYTNNTMRLDAYVMGADGTVTPYTYLDEGKTLTTDGYTKSTVDFTNKAAWTPALPENGYLVAIKVYPLWGMTNGANFTSISGDVNNLGQTGIYYQIDGYKIDTFRSIEGLSANGTEISGLDSSVTYEITTYGIDAYGAGVAGTDVKTISGAEAVDLKDYFGESAAGLYKISETGNLYFDCSSIVYVYGTYKDRGAILDCLDVTSLKTGIVKQNKNFNVGYISNNITCYAMAKTAQYFWTSHESTISTTIRKNFMDAKAGTDSDALATAFKAFKDRVNDVTEAGVYRYAYSPNEIVPISDVYSYKFNAYFNADYIQYKGNTVAFEAYIVDEIGDVKPYTYLISNVDFPSSTPYTVDFKSATGWTEPLPEEGWLVGFCVRPFYGMTDPSKLTITNSTSGVKLQYFHYINDYKIDTIRPLEGLSVNGTVISGLNPDATYTAVTYGIDANGNATLGTDVKTLEKGETADLKDYFGESAAGLYKISEVDNLYFDYSTIIYVKSAYETRSTILESMNGDPYYEAIDSTGKFIIGKLSTDATSYGQQGNISGTAYGMRHATGKVYGADQKAYVQAADDTARATAFNTIKTKFEASTFKYAYNPDEIIPISDVSSYKFGLKAYYNGKSKVEYANNIVAYDAYVMAKDGSLKIYTYLFENDKYGSESKTYVVDFKSSAGWTEELPEEGWLVAFVVHPWYNIESEENLTITSSDGTYSNVGSYFLHYYNDYKIRQDSPKPNLASFPVIAGGYGEVSGFLSAYNYEFQYSTDDGESWSEWADVPEGATAFKVYEGGIYRARVKGTDDYYESDIATVTIDTYEVVGELFESEIAKMHLPNDFVELKAEYEVDLTFKNWVSALALENIKTVSPESVITFAGEDYKFVVTASNISTSGKVHYYNMAVSLDGESRHNTLHDLLVELTGEEYVTDVYFESSNGLPFEEAQLMVEVDASFDGSDIEVRAYSERIDRLRKVEETTVDGGWVTLTNFADTYVLTVK